MYQKYLTTGKSPIDIVFIVDTNKKLLAVLNLNNMIPIVDSSIIEYDITEYKYCMKNRKEIINRGKKIYNMIRLHNNLNLEKRCCNFVLLEKKSEEYMKDLKSCNA